MVACLLFCILLCSHSLGHGQVSQHPDAHISKDFLFPKRLHDARDSAQCLWTLFRQPGMPGILKQTRVGLSVACFIVAVIVYPAAVAASHWMG